MGRIQILDEQAAITPDMERVTGTPIQYGQSSWASTAPTPSPTAVPTASPMPSPWLKVQTHFAPNSDEQIEINAQKYGWSPEEVARIKSMRDARYPRPSPTAVPSNNDSLQETATKWFSKPRHNL